MSAKHKIGGFAGAELLRALFATTRFRDANQPTDVQFTAEHRPVIYMLWHGRLLPLTYAYRNQSVAALISRSGDGEYIARVVHRWGFETARGSSHRGGSTGLRELVRAIRAGHSLAITPDGPRGPRQKVKPGVLTVAQISACPIIPITAAATRGWWVTGWDRFLIPKPFSTIYVRYGAPVFVPRSFGEAELQGLSEQLEQTLNDLTEQADADAQQR